MMVTETQGGGKRRSALPRVARRDGLSLARVEWHLWNWERWMRRPSREGEPPSTASGWDGRTYDHDSERGYDTSCIVAAKAVDAVIDGLSQRLRIAIHVEHDLVAAVYRMRDHEAAYGEACCALSALLSARGLC